MLKHKCLAATLIFGLLVGGVRIAAAADAYRTISAVTYAERDEEELAADVYIPTGAGPFPGVLVVHGGAWRFGERSHMTPVAQKLAENGFTAVSINYRLAPKHLFPAQLDDCRDAVRWMRKEASRYRIDAERIGAFGYSAGGHLVTLLAAAEQNGETEAVIEQPEKLSASLKAVVAGGMPCNFTILPATSQALAYWLGGSRSEKPEAYRLASPTSFITRDDPPMFFFHGEKDILVPILSPLAMQGLLRASGVEAHLYTVAGAGHIAALFDEGARDASIKFLSRHLKTETAESGPTR